VQCNDTCTHSQHTATRCNTLQHPASAHIKPHVCYRSYTHSQHAATRCNTLQHNATQCNTLLRHTYTLMYAAAHLRTRNTHCNTVQHRATRCNTVQHGATRGNTLPQHTYTPVYVAAHMHTCNTLAPRCNTLQHAATPYCGTHTPLCMHIYQHTVKIVDSVRETESAPYLNIYICIYIHICTYKCIYYIYTVETIARVREAKFASYILHPGAA